MLRRLFVLSILFLVLIFQGYSQSIATDVHGSILKVKPYSDVVGSPYFENQEWVRGTVVVSGNQIDDLILSYDLVSDQLLRLDENNNIIMLTVPVSEFRLSNLERDQDDVFRNGFPNVDRQNNKSFYQVLVDGDYKLLKRLTKSVQDRVSYGTSVNERYFDTKTAYYIYSVEEGMMKLSNRSSFLRLNIFDRSVLSDYIQEFNINFREEADLIKLTRQLNSM